MIHDLMNLALVSLCLLPLQSSAVEGSVLAPEDEPPVVRKIIKIDYYVLESDPPQLQVIAVGQVNTGGYTKAKLIRVKHKTPPKDGIQEYRLVATPPSGPAAQVISKVEATDTWRDFTQAGWSVKGIRVYGVGDGVMERRFNAK